MILCYWFYCVVSINIAEFVSGARALFLSAVDFCKFALNNKTINMLAFANAKINLGLNVTEKRPDGYHNLETVFYPIQIKDAIEVIETNNAQFSISGLSIDADVENNLCVKAYRLLKKDFPQLPTVQMHLHKSIPIGAGLGALGGALIGNSYDSGDVDRERLEEQQRRQELEIERQRREIALPVHTGQYFPLLWLQVEQRQLAWLDIGKGRNSACVRNPVG